jgi:hypothetical protein
MNKIKTGTYFRHTRWDDPKGVIIMPGFNAKRAVAVTQCLLVEDKGDSISVSYSAAVCSHKDYFNRKRGCFLAKTRAEKSREKRFFMILSKENFPSVKELFDKFPIVETSPVAEQ